MPDVHARLNPSSAERWIHCPGSVALSEQCPPPRSSEYADEGTKAHSIAEAKLRQIIGEISLGELEKIIKKHKPDGEMDEATDFYRDQVVEILAAAGKDAELMVEQKFSLNRWAPESFGTSDAVVIGDGKIEVIDLKYGKGVKVSAKGNPQLRMYGAGAANLFEGMYDFDTVRMTIIQPRLDHVSTEELPLSELMDWMKDVVKPAAREAYDGTGEIDAGDWCRWCPAKAVCRKRAEKNLELAKMEFKSPDLLSADEIGEVLRQAEELSKWTSDVQAYALEQALAGEHFDGWKLVEGRSNRTITDQIKAAELLKAAGFDEAILFKHELYGITQLEKNCGKKKLTEVIGDLIEKPQGKPVLVPESDKREEINSADAAKADFS
jgi:RecB family exonuclease